MPEGDSIFRLARRLEGWLGEAPLRVTTPHPRGQLAGLGILDGRALEGIDTRGKHLLLRFGGGWVLHSHIAMTGHWRATRTENVTAGTGARAWVTLQSAGMLVAQYRGPTLRILTADRARRDLLLRSLGPDPLADDFAAGAVLGRFRRGDQGRTLADALLDQRLICGPGLIYASEGPARAGVHPMRTLGTLPDAVLVDVVDATAALMREAVRTGHQPRTVQSRKGKPCPTCGTPIAASTTGDYARRVYWCPSCQPAG